MADDKNQEEEDKNQKKRTEQEKKEQIKRLQDTVDRTTEVMVDNIDKILERGELLDEVKEGTDQTVENSQLFSNNARKMHIKAKFKNIALTAGIIGALVGAFYALSAGGSAPLLIAGTGIGGVLFYSVVWMCSGLIQSAMSLPIFNLGFQSEPTKMEFTHKSELEHSPIADAVLDQKTSTWEVQSKARISNEVEDPSLELDPVKYTAHLNRFSP